MAEASGIVTQVRPNMDIGIRPTKPAAENRSAPGLASTSRNGLPGRCSRSLASGKHR